MKSNPTIFLLFLITCLFLAQSVVADEKNKNNLPVWLSSTPPPDNFDWIQLVSGEWLKGELEVLYDGTLEFDSDELDHLSLDWDDVKQVRGHSVHSVKFEFMPTVVGNLQVIGDKVTITSGEKIQYFKRDQIVSIAYGEPKESNYWSAKIKLGLSIKSGNNDSEDFDTSMNIKRRTSASRITFDYIAHFSKTRDIETDNNHRVNFNYDIYATRSYFWRPVFGEYFRDTFQNIQYRVSIGAGIGYHIIDTPKTEWDIVGGPSYLATKFDTVQAGEDLDEATPALVIDTNFDTELSKKVDFIVGYKIQVGNEASGGYTHHSITTLETELTKWLDFDVSFVWDRIGSPTADADGKVPDKDDYRLILSLAVDF